MPLSFKTFTGHILNKFLPAAVLVSVFLTPAARADFVWNFVEDTDTNTVTASYSGSWNFASGQETSAFGPVDTVGYNTHGWLVLHGSVVPVSGVTAAPVSGSLPWSLSGSQSLPNPSQINGSDWGIYYGYAYGPTTFTSSTFISGSYVWANTTLADLSITTPGGTFSGGNTPITWTASTIPEPATTATLLALGSLIFARSRRRTSSRG